MRRQPCSPVRSSTIVPHVGHDSSGLGGGTRGRWRGLTGIRAWHGQKGHGAIMIDCANRMGLSRRFAPRITADDIAEMLREAVFRRFGEVRTRAEGIEFLSGNGPEYTSHRFPPFVPGAGTHPLSHTPAESGVEWLGGSVVRQRQTG